MPGIERTVPYGAGAPSSVTVAFSSCLIVKQCLQLQKNSHMVIASESILREVITTKENSS